MLPEIIDAFLAKHKSAYDFFIGVCKRLTTEQLWQKPGNGLPIANILCHTAEMERFWIDWGLGGNEFERNRGIEFTRQNDLTQHQLLVRLEERFHKTQNVVQHLPEAEWTKEREFHNETLTGIGILHHHLYHLGIHVGHIQMKEQELGTEQY